MWLYEILACKYTWKNIKKSYKSNTFQISAPTWNKEFELLDGSYSIELPDGSYSISDIQDYFKFI